MTPSKPAAMKGDGSQHISQLQLTDLAETEEKRARRKPNFTVQERMHLAQSYVENYEEYNRGFTPITKGEAKIGRQRLLERWAAELSSFGIVERTPVEIEQKIRDYMKKIAANRKRAVKRVMSPPCQLISSVVPESSSVEDSTADDSLTAYAGFLLEQHRAAHNDCTENFEPLRLVSNSYDTGEIKSANNIAQVYCFDAKNASHVSRKRKASSMSSAEKDQTVEQLETNEEEIPVTPSLLKQRMDIKRTDLEMKNIYLEIARKELEKKSLEVEVMKVNLKIKRIELEEKRRDLVNSLEFEQLRRNVNVQSPTTTLSGIVEGTPQIDQNEAE